MDILNKSQIEHLRFVPLIIFLVSLVSLLGGGLIYGNSLNEFLGIFLFIMIVFFGGLNAAINGDDGF